MERQKRQVLFAMREQKLRRSKVIQAAALTIDHRPYAGWIIAHGQRH
jgi:hypothetical protein